DGYTYTLEEVGRIFKVTRERVRQVEAKAIRKLQHPVRARKLRGFVQDEERGEEKCGPVHRRLQRRLPVIRPRGPSGRPPLTPVAPPPRRTPSAPSSAPPGTPP